MRYAKWRLIRTHRLSSPSSRLLSLSLQRFPCVTPGEEIFRLPTSKSCLPMFYLCSLPLLNQYLSPSCFILPSLCHDLSNVYLIFQLPFRVPFFPPYLLPVIPTGSNTSKACLHPSREPFTQTGSVPRPGALRGGQIRSCMENTSRGKKPSVIRNGMHGQKLVKYTCSTATSESDNILFPQFPSSQLFLEELLFFPA